MIAKKWMCRLAILVAVPIFPLPALSGDIHSLNADQILRVETYSVTPSSQTQNAMQPEFSSKLVINGSPSPSSEVTTLLIYFYPENSAKLQTKNSYDTNAKAITAYMRLDQLPAFLNLVEIASEKIAVWCQWQSINAYVDCHGPQSNKKPLK